MTKEEAGVLRQEAVRVANPRSSPLLDVAGTQLKKSSVRQTAVTGVSQVGTYDMNLSLALQRDDNRKWNKRMGEIEQVASSVHNLKLKGVHVIGDGSCLPGSLCESSFGKELHLFETSKQLREAIVEYAREDPSIGEGGARIRLSQSLDCRVEYGVDEVTGLYKRETLVSWCARHKEETAYCDTEFILLFVELTGIPVTVISKRAKWTHCEEVETGRRAIIG